MSDNIGSVSVEVVPDARGFPEKLKAKLRNLEVTVGVNLDAGKAKAQLDKLAMTRRSAKINVDADTKLAAAKLDKLAKNRTTKIRASVDRSSFSRAESAAGGAAKQVSLLEGAVLGLGPALIPATAAVGGLAAALAAPVFSAGAGLGIFGVIETAALGKAVKDMKQITELRKRAAAATTPKAAAALTKQANDLEKSLPKAELAFANAADGISNTFDRLLEKHGSAVFGPLTEGALLVQKVLPKTGPIVEAFGHSVVGVEKDLGRWVDSEQFTHLVQFIDHEGVPAFESFVHIAGNVAQGIGSIVRASAPLGRGVLKNLEGASRGFRDIGDSKGFQSFLGYVRDEGPHVAHVLDDLAVAGVRIVKVLAPQGGLVLTVLDDLSKFVARAKPSQIAAIAGAVGALGLATGKLTPLRGLVLISTAISYAYKHSSAFHTLANDAGKLASALNSLPSGVKVSGALGLAAGALALRGGRTVGGGGGVKGIASKVLGGGVQKVYVVNMPKGGLPGVPGVPGKGKPAEEAAATLSLGSKAGIAGLVAAAVGYASFQLAKANNYGKNPITQPHNALTGGRFGDAARNFSPSLPKIDLGGLNGGTFGKLGRSFDFGKIAAGAKSAGNAIKNAFTGHWGDNFASEGKKVQAAVQHAGLGVKSAALDVTDFEFRASKAGISTHQLGKMMRTLPPTVRTKILTPGALESKKSVHDLAKQFGLTPKQIKTIVKLVGVRDAQNQTKTTQKGLRTLNQTTAKPHVIAQGTEVAQAKVKGVDKTLRILNTHSAKPKVTVEADTSGAARARAAIDSIRGKTVWINIAAAHAGAVHAEIASIRGSRATGGPVSAGQPYLVGERGPELVIPDRSGTVITAAATARAVMQAASQRNAPASAISSDSGAHVHYHGPVYAVDPDIWARKQVRRVNAMYAFASTP